jgi:hypothetical protein
MYGWWAWKFEDHKICEHCCAPGDVRLKVAPTDYWQVNTQEFGMAAAAITPGEAGLAILGLPLMNGYFTVFDGTADGGRGVVKFAKRKG